MELSDSSQNDIRFDFVRFILFLKENNILQVAIAAVLSDRINDVTNSFVDNLVMPIINRDANRDGIKDIKQFEEKQITILGVDFNVGKIVISTFKFLLVTYILFIISKLANIRKFKL